MQVIATNRYLALQQSPQLTTYSSSLCVQLRHLRSVHYIYLCHLAYVCLFVLALTDPLTSIGAALPMHSAIC